MLCELAVTDLGVIGELRLVFGAGMTALTGETGAGKTLVVEAIDLLVGGRADASMVRAGSTETVVEGRFTHGDEEVILRRIIPAEGRSRAYVNGRLATVAELAEWGRMLVDLHGQHAHQSLLSRSAQRAALDHFAQVDIEPLTNAKAELADVDKRLAAYGGSEQERAREMDLICFQLDELQGANLVDPNEDATLEVQESLLADALAHREAAGVAVDALGTDSGARAALALAISALDDRAPFLEIHRRLTALAAEVDEMRAQVRYMGETIEDDPARLEEVRQRRNLLHQLRRKYGRDLAEVIAFRDALAQRISALENLDVVIAALDAEAEAARGRIAAAEAEVGRARRQAAPRLSKAVMANLGDLALGGAHVEIEVGEDPGEDVTYLIATNPGSGLLPLSKVASGGELARTMLALRLVIHEAPDTLIFDEVDAGIGGSAAVAVGRSLGELGDDHQVLVVTHLAQVAAAADNQIVISKRVDEGKTFTVAESVVGDARAEELARMLSGSSGSDAALDHARELLTRG